MTENKTARSTIAYLIVRDQAHENAFAKALESLGVNNLSQAGKLYRGASPSNDGTELRTEVMPDGFPMTISPERREEFAPGLDPELLALIQATAEVELQEADNPRGS